MMDRSLTFHDHTKKAAAKVSTRNNRLNKLAGSTWGANTKTLRSSALALCYSTVEYCATVWFQSSHFKLVDIELNSTMRTTTRTFRPTPLPWLSVLSNIAPPHLRREEATASMVEMIRANPSLPLYQDMFQPPRARLTSRYPVWSSLPNHKPWVTEAWQEE